MMVSYIMHSAIIMLHSSHMLSSNRLSCRIPHATEPYLRKFDWGGGGGGGGEGTQNYAL